MTTLTFGLVRLLPGGPMAYLRSQLLTQASGNTDVAELMEAYTNIQPNKPLLQQYIDYLVAIAHGSLGRSMWYDRPVADIVGEALPWSLLLVVVSLALIYGIGITLGAIMAYTEGSRFDTAVSSIASVLNSIPSYVAGVVFIYLLGYQWSVFPAGGKVTPGTTAGLNYPFIAGVIQHMALPVAAFVITGFGFRALTMRGNSISVLGEEFVRVAQLRGLSERTVALQYVGRNAILPMYTGLLISIGRLLGTTVIIERIFGYEGLGYYMFKAISARDYPLMMGCFIAITTTVVAGVYIADLTYRLLDPTTDGMSSQANITLEELRIKAESTLNNLRRRLSGDAPVSNEVTRADASESLTGGAVDTTVDKTDEYVKGSKSLREQAVVTAEILWEDWRTRIGMSIILCYVAVGLIGPLVLSAPVQGQAPRGMQAFQSFAHPFGTDPSGRDLLSLIVYATAPMLEMILVGAAFATSVATLIGIVAGYAGGVIDKVLMTVSDITLAIPGIPLAIVLGVVFEPTNPALVGLLITVNAWGGIARQIRSETIKIRNHSYVEAAQVMGIPSPRLLYKEILPNLLSFVLIKFVGSGRRVIFASVGLYFLGALPYTLKNWGVIMQLAYTSGALLTMDLAYWLFLPMLAIILLNYGFILFAQGTDRLLNPRIRAKHQDHHSSEESQSDSQMQSKKVSTSD
ncbi:ABC transporter permease subunit [Halobaculum sp. P14]|uniref:ABC transporter permease subunit n=1 Tax=Halobaculum sp. P14 TaxID=3421638 RepID=UPI003EB736C7